MFVGNGPRFREGGSDGVTTAQLLRSLYLTVRPSLSVKPLNVKSYPYPVTSNVHLQMDSNLPAAAAEGVHYITELPHYRITVQYPVSPYSIIQY
jgi:hypothetical protein